MRKLLSILFVSLMLASCSEGDVDGVDGFETAMDVTPFEYKGNHYLNHVNKLVSFLT